MLIVDDLDAVYDLTFADPDYEKADFLARIYGIVRVSGLRQVLESYLNAEPPSSPLRPDRDGFSREHLFAKALLDFIAEELRPVYEKERKRVEEREQGELSSETKKRIDDALKQLNKYGILYFANPSRDPYNSTGSTVRFCAPSFRSFLRRSRQRLRGNQTAHSFVKGHAIQGEGLLVLLPLAALAFALLGFLHGRILSWIAT